MPMFLARDRDIAVYYYIRAENVNLHIKMIMDPTWLRGKGC